MRCSIDLSFLRRRAVRRFCVVLSASIAAGCAASLPKATRDAALLGRQLEKQDDDLIGQSFRTLLDFEHAADAAFVGRTVTGTAAGHTGNFGLLADGSATVNVSSILFGTTLPGDWAVLGGYVRSTGGRTAAALLADGREIARTTRQVPANAYLFTAVDLTSDACRQALPGANKIELRFEAERGFALDDVLLVDNRRTLVDVPGVWSIGRRGLSLTVTFAGRPAVTIPSIAADADGWSVDEIGPLRVRLHDAAGHARTLIADGRSVRDGVMESPDPATVAAHRSPADVAVDTPGRLDRETPGDADNDGYNEQRAAYQIVAAGPRLRLKLTPHGTPAVSPLFEIRGLPAGSHTVTVDGRLIDRTARLPDGTLLVLLPLQIDAPVELTVGVSGE